MQDASFHLAADDGAEDFRADGALSTSAPKVKPRMLADVLWEAANVHLRSQDNWSEHGASEFTCDAVSVALGAMGAYSGKAQVLSALDFLQRLGLPSAASLELFKMFPVGEERQGVRYMWLLLAMHVAEDEGLTA